MSEHRNIVELWKADTDSRRESANGSDVFIGASVLITLVRLEGSSYRKPGARLLSCVGKYAGSISGGCLDGEILRKAAWITRDGAARKTYSTFFDDTNEMPYGLGCGGVVELLFEPLHLPETQALLTALEQSFTGERMAVITLLPSEDGPGSTLQRVAMHADGSVFFASNSLDEASRAGAVELARKHLDESAPHTACVEIDLGGATRTIFLERIEPPQRLILFGAGDDAQPLAKMAHLLGWRVVVADGRPSLARVERFREAEAAFTLPPHADVTASLHLTDKDAVVLLTHSYEQDRALLPQLLPLGLRYLGLLGARHRSRLLLMETAAQLGWTPEECLQHVHAPVGLDLGGDSPEAVALAIVAEIQSVLHEREIQRRRISEKSLLDPPATPYIPVACPLDHLTDGIEEHSDSHPSNSHLKDAAKHVH